MGVVDKIKNAISSILEKIELPDTLNYDVGGTNGGILTLAEAERAIEDLKQHKGVCELFPRHLANLSGISKKFCNHAISALEKYIDVMTSGDKFNIFWDYVESLCDCLDEIGSQCKNANVQKITFDKYNEIFKNLGIRVGGSSSKLVGDYAAVLKKCTEKTKANIREIVKLNPGSPDYKKLLPGQISGLLELLKIEKQNTAKKLLKKFVPNGILRSASLFATGAKNKVISGGKKALAVVFVKQSLDPVEYYDFNDNDFLTPTLAHTIYRILSYYMNTLKSYPRTVLTYVRACNEFIKKFLANLKKYDLSYKILENPKKSELQKSKAKDTMRKALSDMYKYLEEETKEGTDRLFVLLSPKLRSNDPAKARRFWPNGGSAVEVTNVDGNKIELKGWSLGDFIVNIIPLFKKSNNNFESLLFRDLRSRSWANSPINIKKIIKEIAEVLQKSISIYKKVEKSYNSLKVKAGLDKQILKAFSESYDVFKDKFEKIKTFPREDVEYERKLETAEIKKVITGAKLSADGTLALVDKDNCINKSIFESIESNKMAALCEFIWEHCYNCSKDILKNGNDFINDCKKPESIVFKASEKDSKQNSGEEFKEKIERALYAYTDLAARKKEAFDDYKKDFRFGKVGLPQNEDILKREINNGEATWAKVVSYYNECKKLAEEAQEQYKKLVQVKVEQPNKKTIGLVKNGQVNESINFASIKTEDRTEIDTIVEGLYENKLKFDANLKILGNLIGYVRILVSRVKEVNKAEAVKASVASHQEVNDNEFKERIEEAFKKYSIHMIQLSRLSSENNSLDIYRNEFGFGKISKSLSEKIIKKSGEEWKAKWEEAKKHYVKCKNCLEEADKQYNKLLKIQIGQKKGVPPVDKDGHVFEGINFGIIKQKKINNIIKYIINPLTENIDKFSENIEKLKKLIEEMRKQVENMIKKQRKM